MSVDPASVASVDLPPDLLSIYAVSSQSPPAGLPASRARPSGLWHPPGAVLSSAVLVFVPGAVLVLLRRYHPARDPEAALAHRSRRPTDQPPDQRSRLRHRRRPQRLR